MLQYSAGGASHGQVFSVHTLYIHHHTTGTQAYIYSSGHDTELRMRIAVGKYVRNKLHGLFLHTELRANSYSDYMCNMISKMA